MFSGKSFVYYLMSEDSMSERECIVHAVDAYSAGKDTVTKHCNQNLFKTLFYTVFEILRNTCIYCHLLYQNRMFLAVAMAVFSTPRNFNNLLEAK